MSDDERSLGRPVAVSGHYVQRKQLVIPATREALEVFTAGELREYAQDLGVSR